MLSKKRPKNNAFSLHRVKICKSRSRLHISRLYPQTFMLCSKCSTIYLFIPTQLKLLQQAGRNGVKTPAIIDYAEDCLKKTKKDKKIRSGEQTTGAERKDDF